MIQESYLYVMIPVIVGGITQITKFTLYSWKHGFNWSYFFTHGHMPSTHSAFVVSLILTTGNLAGYDSAAFLIAFSLGIIIIDDALRLRMYLGDQGRYLNMLIENLQMDPNKYPRLKERIGHRSSEVVVGIVYGFILTSLLIYFF
ncbi:MAG: divergent PAP2 family protein [Candidatus Moraniibacteriota bacterium]